ncbi:hypothetical protein PLEI_2301 [Photobacterium leiognathi lrivu.4.1]|uniref:Uncharacterized protein n=1 Tax=Photobacterium leiognathi lrivu.4.1 TaxID=1248232 RepID=A0A0U1P8A1_PHOLE|nr:hypothetical protein PLEI_2301 [Photobacterium leiognathi lrivu.4.1]
MTRLFCICVLIITADFAVFSAIACWELDRQPGRISPPLPYSKASSEMTRLFCICISVITAGFAVFNAIDVGSWINSPQLSSKSSSEMTRLFAFLFKKKHRVVIHLSSLHSYFSSLLW